LGWEREEKLQFFIMLGQLKIRDVGLLFIAANHNQ
jgi:hypothetical protein